jgi:hypothetical protein
MHFLKQEQIIVPEIEIDRLTRERDVLLRMLPSKRMMGATITHFEPTGIDRIAHVEYPEHPPVERLALPQASRRDGGMLKFNNGLIGKDTVGSMHLPVSRYLHLNLKFVIQESFFPAAMPFCLGF